MKGVLGGDVCLLYHSRWPGTFARPPPSPDSYFISLERLVKSIIKDLSKDPLLFYKKKDL